MAFKLFEKVITALYPDRCLFCGKVVTPGLLCCRDCKASLPLQPQGRVEAHNDDPFSFIAAPFCYRDGVRRAIIQMKFYGHREAADFFVPYMVKALAGYAPDMVVAVPMAEHRQKERGFYQAELLARPIAEALNSCYVPDMLRRTGSVVQHDLSARLRRLEADKSFELSPNANAVGKRILLVDDIFTTGSTLRRCAWLLKNAGAEEVVCVAAAATPQQR